LPTPLEIGLQPRSPHRRCGVYYIRVRAGSAALPQVYVCVTGPGFSGPGTRRRKRLGRGCWSGASVDSEGTLRTREQYVDQDQAINQEGYGHILPDAISLGRDKAKAQASGLFMPFNPDYAARKFAEDARRRARRRTLVLQVPDNAADSAKLRAPCGFKCLRYKAG